MPSAYTFTLLTETDLETVQPWLLTPAVRRWYPDADYIEDIADQLDDEHIQMNLVCHEGEPFAYIQDYDIHAWKDHHLSFLPKGSRGLDTFIGRPDMIGTGHGTAYIQLHVDKLFKNGAPAIGIDPDPKNAKAIRAYEKVGFQRHNIVESKWGTFLTMTLEH